MSAIYTVYGFEFNFNELSPASLEYLLKYGASQSLQDSVASVKAKAKKDGKSDDEVGALVKEAMAKRHAAILAGTIGFRHPSEKVSPLDAMIAKVGREELTAMAKAKGTKLPVKEKYDALFTAALERFAAKWTAEAERRLALTADVEEGDGLDDFFASDADEETEETAPPSDETGTGVTLA